MSRMSVRVSVGTVGRPIRRRLLQAHHSRKPRRCQAMTISGLTMTSVVRHPVSTRESTTQSQRSACASRNRRGRERCSTCSWCRKASTSSWSAARERAHVRRVRRSETSTDIIAQKRIQRWPQHQLPQQERTFQQPQDPVSGRHPSIEAVAAVNSIVTSSRSSRWISRLARP
jgi:hypothetical protein